MSATALPADLHALRAQIELDFDARATLDASQVEALRPRVERVMSLLESGIVRVAEPGSEGWVVNQWLKKAVLLYFRCNDMRVMEAGAPGPFWDKVPTRFEGFGEAEFRALGSRVVPGAVVRRGSYLGIEVFVLV